MAVPLLAVLYELLDLTLTIGTSVTITSTVQQNFLPRLFHRRTGILAAGDETMHTLCMTVDLQGSAFFSFL